MKKRKWFQRLLVLLLIVSMAAPVNTAVYAAELTDEIVPAEDESMDFDTSTDERKPDETNDAADDVDIENNTDPSDIDPDDTDKTGNPSDTDSVQPIDPDKTASDSQNPDADNDTENKNEDLDISDETVTVEETEEAVAPMSLYASANEETVAKVGNTEYSSVSEAISTETGDVTIVLLKDTTESVTIPTDRTVTLDLNGKTLTAEEKIEVSGNLTIKDASGEGKIVCSNKDGGAVVASGTVTLESGTIKNDLGYGIYAIEGGTAIVKGGEINSQYAALTGNNTTGNMNFTVNGGTLTAKQGPAIYMPGQGNLTITDGTLNGGISLRMGQVNISGGTINAIKTDIDSPAEYYNYSGNAWLPDALYVFGGTYTSDDSQYGNSLSLNITGGTFNCENEQGSAVAIYDLGKTGQTEEIKISGNAVLKTNAKDRQAYQVLSLEDIGVTSPANGYGSETLVGKVNTAISGGSFSTAVSPEYCADGYDPTEAILSGGYFTVKTNEDKAEDCVAQVGDYKYETLKDAIYAVQKGISGDIKLLKDLEENVTIPADMTVTLDLNGKTLTAEEEIEVSGNLTIKDVSGEGKIVCSNKDGGAVVASGTVTLESGTIKNDLGYGIYAIEGGTAIVKGGEINSQYAALTGNNTTGNMNFTVNGGTLTAKQGPAIYMPGQGNLTITDGTLNGGISLRMGQVNISGGTINAIKTDIDSPAEYYNYSGNAWLPDALYVFGGTYTSDDSQYGNSLSLNITGGTFNCENEQGSAVAIYDLGKTEQKEEIKISGNAVLKTNAKDRQAYQVLSLEDIGVTNPANGYGSETLVGKVNTAISAGSFSTLVSSEYCADGFVPSGVLKDGMYTVTKPTAAAPTNNTNNTSSSGSKKHHKSSKDSDSEESAAAAVSAAQSVTSARTGDSTNIWFPVLLLLAALAGAGSCGYMAVFRKKRK